MFGLFRKSKKNGPLKALSSVFTSEEKASENGFDDSISCRVPPSSPPQPSELSKLRKNRQQYSSKDDLSVLTKEQQEKKKSKVQANPYATIKMWRPITMSSSVSHDDDAYRNFTNFDVLVADAKLPATGDLRNENFHRKDGSANGAAPDSVTATSSADSTGDTVPPDYHSEVSRDSSLRNGKLDKAGAFQAYQDYRKQFSGSTASDIAGSRSVRRAESLALPSSAVTIPLKSRMLNVQEQQEQEQTLVPPPRRSRQISRSTTFSVAPSVNGVTDIPADYPMDSSSSSSRGSRSLSQDGYDVRQRSPDRKGRSIMDSSHDVVSADVSKSVRGVLSKTYGPEGFERAGQDVEVMLGHLKATMETLKTSQVMVQSSSGQFLTVRQELQLQTKQFVQEAKAMVAGATGSRQAVSPHLHSAMHTLARLFLHSQAMMVRMRSVHLAQHVGFEVLKVSTSFKSTVAAATAAMGHSPTDPHMKYLMRQATHLAGLLCTLLKTLKNLEQS